MVAGYVTGDETLFDGIKQIRNGEFLTYQKERQPSENVLLLQIFTWKLLRTA